MTQTTQDTQPSEEGPRERLIADPQVKLLRDYM